MNVTESPALTATLFNVALTISGAGASFKSMLNQFYLGVRHFGDTLEHWAFFILSQPIGHDEAFLRLRGRRCCNSG